MTPRIRNTRQAAESLGMTVRAFMALRIPDFGGWDFSGENLAI